MGRSSRRCFKRLATRVKLDGFRPGKAPVAMIKARLGKQAIYDEATDQILQKDMLIS